MMADHNSNLHDQSSSKSPACDICREKKVRCGREKPICHNCKTWNTACSYSERQKRDNEQSRLTQKFDEVHDRLERIENAIQQLANALVQNPANGFQGAPGSATPAPATLARSVGSLLSSSRQLGALVADKHGELQYLGPNSLSSITFEAGSIAQQTLKSKIPMLSGRSRTEASDVLKGLNRLKANVSSVLLEDNYEEPLEVGGKSWWLPERDVVFRYCAGYFDTFNRLCPIFSRKSFMDKLNTFYEHPPKAPDVAWLACLNNVVLFASYDTRRGVLTEGEMTKRLVSNSWLALRENILFLTPRLVNVQALIMSAVIVQQQSRPGLCWMLICQACRLAQAIGLHRKSDKSRFRDESEYEERKWLFWNLYILDKTLSMTFGRTVCMPDFDIDVDMPKESEEVDWPLLMAWTWLAKIQSRIYERLYSATAYMSGDEQRHSAALELDAELRAWSEKNMQPLCERQTTFLEGKYIELELRFNYHNSLVMIHRVNHGGGQESEQICLDSARDALAMIKTTFSNNSELAQSDLALWLYLYYPFTPFFTLFTNIVRNPHLPTTQHDLGLIRHVRDHLGMMKANSIGAARLWRVAHLFTRMAETLVEEYVQDPEKKSLGKRKRNNPRRQSNPMEPASDEPFEIPTTDMRFLRSVQQPQADEEDNQHSSNPSTIMPLNMGIEQTDGGYPAVEYESSIALQTPSMESANYVHDQMLNAAGQGTLDFDWVLWDQCLEPNFGFAFDPPANSQGDDAGAEFQN